MKKWWVSWYDHPGNFTLVEYEYPWWITGYRADGKATFCAAVIAPSEVEAKEQIVQAYRYMPVNMEWRFCEEKPEDWEPFCERFPRSCGMQWPEEG